MYTRRIIDAGCLGPSASLMAAVIRRSGVRWRADLPASAELPKGGDAGDVIIKAMTEWPRRGAGRP
jgi:hypothetical protein